MNMDLTNVLTKIKDHYKEITDGLLMRTYIHTSSNVYKLEINCSGKFFYVHISGNDRYQEIPWIIDDNTDGTDITFLTSQISKYINRFDK